MGQLEKERVSDDPGLGNGKSALTVDYAPTDDIVDDLNPFAAGVAKRHSLRHSVGHLFIEASAPIGRALCKPPVMRKFPYVPTVSRVVRTRNMAHVGAWDVELPPIPKELLTKPGVETDPAAQQDAFEKAPLYSFLHIHHEAILFTYKQIWEALIQVAPRLTRGVAKCHRVSAQKPKTAPVETDPQVLAREVKEFGKKIGISALGITKYDPKYTFKGFEGRQVGDNVIAMVLEQNYEATQVLPNVRADKAALICYAEMMDLAAELAEFLQAKGYKAHPHDFQGETVVLKYAVAAGLGQMGLNGQILTPKAGSRCRVTIIVTDAPLAHDEPVDYGIPGVCDRCKACVERCPSGAIPANRKWYRGVMKAKLNSARCFPLVSQLAGCGICMKVCPIQKYGLPEVLKEFIATGKIKGKGTDELEGYNWPLDGRRYGPGERPRIPKEFFRPTEMRFDPKRTLPIIPFEEAFSDFTTADAPETAGAASTTAS